MRSRIVRQCFRALPNPSSNYESLSVSDILVMSCSPRTSRSFSRRCFSSPCYLSHLAGSTSNLKILSRICNINLFRNDRNNRYIHLTNQEKQYSKSAGEKSSTMDEKILSHHSVPPSQVVVTLPCNQAFDNLTEKEKSYAHYLSQAAWKGGLIVLLQTSPESPVIFYLLHKMFKKCGVEGLKEIAMKQCSFTEDEWNALLAYTCGLLTFMGNYKGFGDVKIVPRVPVEKIESMVTAVIPDDSKYWLDVKKLMFSLGDKERQLGLGDKGITTYFSANCTEEDSQVINRFMKSRGIEGYNTRVFKTMQGETPLYEIRLASSLTDKEPIEQYDFEGAKFQIAKGDHSFLLATVVEELEKALDFVSNDNEKQMLQCYIKSFGTGSLDAHKDGSRFWIKNKSPVIETYIGFIETYRDPTGSRGEFEGFVSIVNRPMSKKFMDLVNNAPKFLKYVPWPKEFEREVYIEPDFTSLDVLTFSGSGIPAGINIPNYDEIRQNEGFKNVSLGNVIPASYKDSNLPFIADEDKEMFLKYRIPSFEVQVGLHELLGHGSGKLLRKDENGYFNFNENLTNPLNGKKIEKTYLPGETYDSVFTSLGSAMEECRAECVGLLLSLESDILKTFGHEGAEAENIIYTNWLSMVYAGVARALEVYQPKTEKWMQAHSMARFVITKVLLEAGEGFISVAETVDKDGKPDLLIKLDRSKIRSVGKKSISDFLLKLQVYKSTADFEASKKLFDYYSKVVDVGDHRWKSWRDIIMDRKQPRKMFVQPNTSINGDGKVEMKTYVDTPSGLIESWIDRFDESIYDAILSCWKKDRVHY